MLTGYGVSIFCGCAKNFGRKMKILRDFVREKYRDLIIMFLVYPMWFYSRYVVYDEAVWGRWGVSLTFFAVFVIPIWLAYTFVSFVRNR